MRPTTQSLNILIEIRRFTKKKGFMNRFPKREKLTQKPKREREISEGSLKHVRFRASLKHKNVGQIKFIKTKLTEIRYKIK